MNPATVLQLCLVVLSVFLTVLAFPGGTTHEKVRIHVPKKIHTVYVTKYIKVPQHHHHHHKVHVPVPIKVPVPVKVPVEVPVPVKVHVPVPIKEEKHDWESKLSEYKGWEPSFSGGHGF